MDKGRMAELEKIEAHGAENGWVAPMTEEDREFFAYFHSVFKRYNISPSKATRLEYDFVTRVAESEFYLQKANARGYSLSIAPQLLSCHPCRNHLHNTLLRVTMQPTATRNASRPAPMTVHRKPGGKRF